MSSTPYSVRKRRPGTPFRVVTHRDSNRLLGYVARHPQIGGALDNRWGAYSPWSNDPVGEPERLLHDACMQLLDPELLRPAVVQRRNARGRALETLDAAIRRCRKEHHDWWRHHAWLEALSGEASAPAVSALAQQLALADWTSVAQDETCSWPGWPSWSIWRAPKTPHYVALLEDTAQLWHDRGNLLLTLPLAEPADALKTMRILRMSLPQETP